MGYPDYTGGCMPVLELKKSVNAAPELVWQVVSDMETFARVAPNLTRVDVIREQGSNLRRQLFDKQGRSWDEERIAVTPGSESHDARRCALFLRSIFKHELHLERCCRRPGRRNPYAL